jgi:hypothetical protein
MTKRIRKAGAYLCRRCLYLFVGDPKRRFCPDCEFYKAFEEGRVFTVSSPPPPSLDVYRAAICRLIAQRGQLENRNV